MAIYRQIQVSFWQDGFVEDLKPQEKYFYFYLLTNSRTAQCGIYEFNKSIAEAETGYSKETIDNLLKTFEQQGKILYCKETKEIIILNWIKYNFINSKNTMCCMNKELKGIKNKNFINILYEKCLSLGYSVKTVFKDIALDSKEEKAEVDTEKQAKDEENSNDNMDENAAKVSPYLIHSEGASKDLGEEEIEKDIYIQEASSNKEKVIRKKEENFYSKNINAESELLREFNKNIHKATIRDMENLNFWKKDFEEQVIIQGIYESVKYKAPHIGYLESVLKSWKSSNVVTIKDLKAYKHRRCEKDGFERFNEAAYRYVD